MSFDPHFVNPIVWIPAQDLAGNEYVVSMDYRLGFPPVHRALPLPQGLRAPYDLLVHSTRPFVYATASSGAGNLIVYEIKYAGGIAPGISATFTATAPPSPYATRLTEDVATGNLLVPSATGVDVRAVPGLAVVGAGTIATPTGTIVGTNVATRFGAAGQNTGVVGLRTPTPQTAHGWLAVDGSTGTGIPSGANPFGSAPSGQAWILAPGFFDLAMTSDVNGPIATFLLSDPANPGILAGQISVLQNQAGVPTNTANTPAVHAPFGNPEPLANPAGAVAVLLGTAIGGATDFVGVVGTTAGTGVGSYATAATSGFLDPATVDRPMALPLGNEFCVNSSIGTNGIDVYGVTIAAGPVVNVTATPPGVAPTQGPASGLPTVLRGGLTGPLPLFIQGFAGVPGTFNASDNLIVSQPLVPPYVAAQAVSANVYNAVTGGLVLNQPAAPPANLGARRAAINFVNGQSTNIRMLFPVTFQAAGVFFSLIEVAAGTSSASPFPASATWKPPVGNLLLTSEILSL